MRFLLKAIRLNIVLAFLITPGIFSIAQATSATPEALLPKGVDSAVVENPYTGEKAEVRKGTIGATLVNIAHLNALMLQNIPSQEMDERIDAIRVLIPSLRTLGLFNLFSLSEWLEDNTQAGRQLTCVLYLQTYPEFLTASIKKRLSEIKANTKSDRLKVEISKILK